MDRLEIKDPNYFVYPLSRQIYYDPKVVYHGTRSSFAESIESKGWKLNDVPYDRSDAKLVCDIFYSVGYTDRADFLFGVFKLDATIRASFTHNYWLTLRKCYVLFVIRDTDPANEKSFADLTILRT